MPSMSDEVVMVNKKGTIFLGGPQLTEAATKEKIDAESLGGAMMHCEVSGVSDGLAWNEAHALDMARSIVANLSTKSFYRENSHHRVMPEEPLFD